MSCYYASLRMGADIENMRGRTYQRERSALDSIFGENCDTIKSGVALVGMEISKCKEKEVPMAAK